MCVRDKRIMTIAKCMKRRKVKEDKEKNTWKKMFTHYAIEKKQSGLKTIVDLMLEKNSKHVNIQGILLMHVRTTQDMNRKAFINVR